jgi:hypothetical protein
VRTIVVPLPKQKARTRNRVRRRGNANNTVVSARTNLNSVRKTTRTNTARDGHMCRFRGTDFLAAINTTGALLAGDVINTWEVNPTRLGVSRLATVAKLWERYKFRRLSFRYAPIAPSTTGGELLGYVDYDTYDNPTGLTGDQNLQRAWAHLGNRATKLWESGCSWDLKDLDPLTDLYIDSDGSDNRWTNQGRFILLAGSAIAGSLALGNIYIDYDVEFYIPQLELTPSTGYGWKQVGGGTLNAANLFGTTRTIDAWSNIPITCTSTVMTIPAGSYIIAGLVEGGTISAVSNASTGTLAGSFNDCVFNAAATHAMYTYYGYSTVPWTYTPSITATTVTKSNWVVGLLPSNAVTLTQKRLNQISRMLSLCGEVDHLKDVCIKLSEDDSKEAKVCKTDVSSSSCSSSSASSGFMGSLERSKSSIDTDEDYIRVPKRVVKQ